VWDVFSHQLLHRWLFEAPCDGSQDDRPLPCPSPLRRRVRRGIWERCRRRNVRLINGQVPAVCLLNRWHAQGRRAPTSKQESLRVLTDAVVAAQSYAMVERRRQKFAEAYDRDAQLGPASLMLSDVSTLYFETDAGAGSASRASPRNVDRSRRSRSDCSPTPPVPAAGGGVRGQPRRDHDHGPITSRQSLLQRRAEGERGIWPFPLLQLRPVPRRRVVRFLGVVPQA
jgi:hypothetical protein